tara:strand:- start:291 stop:473 length:183 start_codon:yes stop_codon:yes gene_type:complete
MEIDLIEPMMRWTSRGNPGVDGDRWWCRPWVRWGPGLGVGYGSVDTGFRGYGIDGWVDPG